MGFGCSPWQHMHSIINWLLLIAFVNLSLFIENSTLVQRRSLLSLALSPDSKHNHRKSNSPDSKHNHLKSDSKVFYHDHIQSIIIKLIIIEKTYREQKASSFPPFEMSATDVGATIAKTDTCLTRKQCSLL